MLKLITRHFIYDACIHVIIDKLTSSFGMMNTDIPKKGDFYKRISHNYNDEHYYNCIVRNVDVMENESGELFYIVYVNHDYAAGIDYENWKNYADDAELEIMETGVLSEEDEDLFFDEDIDDPRYDEDTELLEFSDCIAVNSMYYKFIS